MSEIDEPLDLAVARAELDGADLQRRVEAAAVLGRVGDVESAGRIEALFAEVLGHAGRQAVGHVAVALERTGDAGAAGRVQALIGAAPDWAVFWLVRVVRRLSGRSVPQPEVSWQADPDGYFARLREAWGAIDLTQPPTPTVHWGEVGGSRAEAAVYDGRSVYALAPDDVDAKSAWPEWNYSWYHSGERLYCVGNICETCEVWLSHAGWSPREAVELAQAVRAAVADVRGLDAALLTAVEPLMRGLASSRYQLRLIDLPLETATWADTWYADNAFEGPSDPEEEPADPAELLRFYQPPRAERVHPLVIAPTQPGLDTETVAAHAAAITAGARPTAIVAAHIAERQAWDADAPHTSLAGFVLDGHHKLAAYAATGTPARILLIADRTPPLATAPDPVAAFDRLIAEAGGRDAGA